MFKRPSRGGVEAILVNDDGSVGQENVGPSPGGVEERLVAAAINGGGIKRGKHASCRAHPVTATAGVGLVLP